MKDRILLRIEKLETKIKTKFHPPQLSDEERSLRIGKILRVTHQTALEIINSQRVKDKTQCSDLQRGLRIVELLQKAAERKKDDGFIAHLQDMRLVFEQASQVSLDLA